MVWRTTWVSTRKCDRIQRDLGGFEVAGVVGAGEEGLGPAGVSDRVEDVAKPVSSLAAGSGAHRDIASARARSATSGRRRSGVAMSTG